MPSHNDIASKYGPSIFLGSVFLLGLYACSRYNYLLFHTLVEFFSVVVGLVVFVLAWNTRRVQENQYLLFLGIACLFTGALEMLHTLAYKGFGVFPGHDADLPTQLWIAFRYLFSISFLAAPLFIRRRLNVPAMIGVFTVVTSFLVWSIFAGIFPSCFVEGSGLTRFKIISEYVIIGFFCAALLLLRRERAALDRGVFRLIILSTASSIVSELTFTQYASVFGFSNMLGHLFLLLSVYFVYRAIVVTGIVQPSNLLFRSLTLSEEAIKQSEAKYRALFENMIDGFAFHRIITNAEGKPVDYEFLEVNNAFERLTGLRQVDIIGKRVTAVLPGIEQDPADWIGLYGAVALSGKEARFERYTPVLDKWYSVSAYSPLKEHFVAIFADITKRKRAEQALTRSEAKYRLLFENMAEGFALYELLYDEHKRPVDWRVLEINDAYTHHTGVARDRIVGRRMGEVFPSIIAEYLPLFAEVVATGKAREFETYSKAVDRYLNIVCFPAGPDRFANTIVDVTERKRAEAALRDYELKASALMNAADESIWLFGLDGEILAANATAAQRMGKRVDEVLGKRWPELMTPELAASRAKRMDEVLRTGGPVRFEDARGGIIFSHSANPVRDDAGNIRAVAIFSRDITELKRAEEALQASEERLRFALETSHTGAWDLDLEDHTAFRSAEHDRIFGYPDLLPQWTYEMFIEHVLPEDRADVDGKFQQAMKTRSDWSFECRIRRADGEVRWIWAAGRHRPDAAGASRRMAGIIQDITERKRVEEEISRRIEELHSLNEELSRFNRAMEGRELRMIQLKKEINELCARTGQQPRYPLEFEKEG
ncbi:MAG TPA: MASE3 domain-containing protein [Nitrospirota bacterium]